MLQSQVITTSTIIEILDREDAATSVFLVILSIMAVAVLTVVAAVGMLYLSSKVPNKLARYLIAWSALPVLIGGLASPQTVLGSIDIKSHPEVLRSDLETAVTTEITAQYHIQEVQIPDETDEDGNYRGIGSWIHTLTNDSLEPARIIVRLEEGPTVPYELRLVADTVELYPLHGDITAPNPQELRKSEQ